MHSLKPEDAGDDGVVETEVVVVCEEPPVESTVYPTPVVAVASMLELNDELTKSISSN